MELKVPADILYPRGKRQTRNQAERRQHQQCFILGGACFFLRAVCIYEKQQQDGIQHGKHQQGHQQPHDAVGPLCRKRDVLYHGPRCHLRLQLDRKASCVALLDPDAAGNTVVCTV